MEELSNKGKEFILKQMKEELIEAITNLTISDIKSETIDYGYGDELMVGLMIRTQHTLTPEGIEFLNNLK